MRSCLSPPAVYTTNTQAEGAHKNTESDSAKPATNPQTQEFVSYTQRSKLSIQSMELHLNLQYLHVFEVAELKI